MKGWKKDEPLLALTDDPNRENRKRKRADDDLHVSKTKGTSSASMSPAPTPASTSPTPTPSIDKPEQGESEAAESDADVSTNSDEKNTKDIAKDDDQKPSQNNHAGHFDDVCQLELEVDGWDGDWLDAWRSPAGCSTKRPESPMIRRRS
ncbi:unnamed protein product [Symbiodinium sp. CCMP2592]|nr:unnamed protein product [Symbiodinium sp. CCMP2592]